MAKPKKPIKPKKARSAEKSKIITEKRKVRESLKEQEKEKKSQYKVGDRIQLGTGSKVLKVIAGHFVWIYEPEIGGETQRSSKTKLGLTGEKSTPISSRNLGPGDICQFNYHGDFAHDPAPICIVFSDGPFKGFIHAINIKYLDTSSIRILRNIILAFYKEMESPLSFYNSKLKSILKTFGMKDISSYRTYYAHKMFNVKLFYGAAGEDWEPKV